MSGWPSYPSQSPNGGGNVAEASSIAVPAASPPPPVKNPMGRIRLSNLSDVAKEIRKLYREARAGTLATQEATKLAYLLNMLASILTASDLEERLAALEGDKPK